MIVWIIPSESAWSSPLIIFLSANLQNINHNSYDYNYTNSMVTSEAMNQEVGRGQWQVVTGTPSWTHTVHIKMITKQLLLFLTFHITMKKSEYVYYSNFHHRQKKLRLLIGSFTKISNLPKI